MTRLRAPLRRAIISLASGPGSLGGVLDGHDLGRFIYVADELVRRGHVRHHHVEVVESDREARRVEYYELTRRGIHVMRTLTTPPKPRGLPRGLVWDGRGWVPRRTSYGDKI